MAPLLTLVAIALLVCLALLIFFTIFRRNANKKPSAQPASATEVETRAVVRSGRSGTGRMRQRRGRTFATSEGSEQQGDGDAAHDQGRDEGDEEEAEGEEGRHRGKDHSKKEVKKQEKQSRREAEKVSREIKEEKSSRYAEKQRRKDDEREEAEEKRAAELAEFEARKAAEASAELDKWKDMFQVETEGTVEDDAQEESQGLLHEFVDYIKRHKCVVLEDLAAEFGLRAQDVVSRVTSLEQMGRISGVMDDRGKFIYVSVEEMKAVAEYIEQRGRVSIAHLAEKSVELIDLEPKAEELEGKSLEEPWMAEEEINPSELVVAL